ncbi:juvenile hormone esterase-like [Diorhabda sublineata]|uniref:juvenile hormone esterase-like n=1 Tax=Diorhabda sublineata TaxID=1163346 RepID=UPI0024E0E056|nr:juvenile hormone esterase-like [Diorhabda sublineata]
MTLINLFKLFFLIEIFVDINYTYADDTIVEIESGKIRGHILKSENGNDYYAFQEIPYAAKPIGENRFQLPKPPEPWSGILDTTNNTKICYQYTKKYANLEISEDCLYINVYTPQKPSDAKVLPVLLWIHGGGFVNESSTFEYYGPKYIMDHRVVVVTFNYRLGPFGFVGTDDGVIPANIGLKDQLFAIQWVNRNIKAFSGNPYQVTLVGESAGSISVGYHLLGPWVDDKQIFHAAIMQSGSPVGIELKTQNTTNEAYRLAQVLDPTFNSSDSRDILKFLQNATAEDILHSGVTGAAVIEKDGPFSHEGFPSFLNQNYKKVPVIIGFNSEEMAFLVYSKNETQYEKFDADPSLLVDKLINMSPENRTIAGTLLKQLYTQNTSFEENYGGYIRYISDNSFTTATCKQVELASSEAPYYLYQFSYKGEIGGMTSILPLLPPNTGNVGHAEDLHYMWDDGSNSDLSQFPEEDGVILHRYVQLWTNFVKYFVPTPEPVGNITWLPSEPSTLRYLNINSTFEMLDHPRQYQQVKEILETYMEPPYTVFK